MSAFYKQISKTVLADGWGCLVEYVFKLKRRDGSWQQQKREVYERGGAVACLLRNPENDHVLLTRQFRLPCFLVGQGGYMIEAPAGMLDAAEPMARMRAELEEETGYRIKKLTRLFELISSPGGFDETVVYFLGDYNPSDQVSDGGGLVDEGEDIEVFEVSLNEALEMVTSGKIIDAKTVILLQQYALQR